MPQGAWGHAVASDGLAVPQSFCWFYLHTYCASGTVLVLMGGSCRHPWEPRACMQQVLDQCHSREGTVLPSGSSGPGRFSERPRLWPGDPWFSLCLLLQKWVPSGSRCASVTLISRGPETTRRSPHANSGNRRCVPPVPSLSVPSYHLPEHRADVSSGAHQPLYQREP